MPARYAIGIDLGTSHCALAYVRLDAPASAIALLPLPQRSSAAELQADALLPALRYQGSAAELQQTWQQPWPALGADQAAPAVIGRWARSLGAGSPQRLVASAKSWLSHAGVDRSAPILPWGTGPEVAKISPLQASASYLAHLRAAWDAAHPQDPLARQQVVLTVPASFDEGARALTLQAAELAGLPPLQLLEEPKAAFQDWLVLQGAGLASALADSRLVLVVDVGGGTTDLTLIRVQPATEAEPPTAPSAVPPALPTLTRCAVGEHLMLGGDNMDLALAHRLEPLLSSAPGQRLAPARFAELVQRCRSAKEQLLAANAPESVIITLLGAGSRLLAQQRSTVLTRAQVQEWVVEAFLPAATLDQRPARHQGALRSLSLPDPADAAISRHLAQFLAQHASLGLPDTLLLNGGVFHGQAIAQRLCTQLAQWRGAALRLLHNPHPDWAVARGAAAQALLQYQAKMAFANARPGDAAIKSAAKPTPAIPQIGGGAARSYWLVLPGSAGGPAQALCLLPRGTEEGVRLVLSGRRFALTLGQPVRFGLVARSQGQAQAGQIVALQGEGWSELPPLASVLPAPAAASPATAGQRPPAKAQQQVQVQLRVCMSEVGTLEVECLADSAGAADGRAAAPQVWRLPFAVRGPVPAQENATKNIAASHGQTPANGHNDPKDPGRQPMQQAQALIDRVFGDSAQAVALREVRQLRQALEKTLGPRQDWPLAQLRPLCDALLACAKRRRRTPEHERSWLNLVGWCLRPGLGAQLDAWRVQQLWQLYPQALAHPGEPGNWTQWWVLWRRVAAGLDEAQQMQVLEDVAGCMQKAVQRSGAARSRWGSYDDMLRLFAAMEAVPWQYRQEMGQWMLARLAHPDEPQHSWWAIGRLAARSALAANAHQVMPAQAAQEFLAAALEQDWRSNEHAMFAAVQIARKTGERTLDLPEEQRTLVLQRLQASGAPERWQQLVREVVELQPEDQQRSLGDSLPPGLVLLG